MWKWCCIISTSNVFNGKDFQDHLSSCMGFVPTLSQDQLNRMWFQQDGASAHTATTARSTMHFPESTFQGRLFKNCGQLILQSWHLHIFFYENIQNIPSSWTIFLKSGQTTGNYSFKNQHHHIEECFDNTCMIKWVTLSVKSSGVGISNIYKNEKKISR